MAVKLDVSINWITNLNNLEKSILAMNSRIQKMSKAFTKGYSLLGAPDRTQADIASLEKYQKIFNKLYVDYEKMNKQGKLAGLWMAMSGYKPTGDKKRGILSTEELSQYTSTKAWQEVDRLAAKRKWMEDATTKTSPSYKAYKQKLKEAEKNEYHIAKSADITARQTDSAIFRLKKAILSEEKKAKIQEHRNEEAEAKDIQQRRKLDIKRNLQHSRALEENKKRDETLRKKQWMLMLGKWGRFGVWGLVAQQAIRYISKAVGFAYSTSMQGLDWQRTISGGASGGSWFGQGLAGYQRAGIGANQYQSFKRGIQGYLGSVKLGMGNAAPLMYLGLSALDNPDELERQLEQSLRRLPKDVSLALAGQMGLDYNMWEAIYSGRLDRQRSAYSEEAIQKWARLADSLNDLITNLKTFFFNKLAPVAETSASIISNSINRGSNILTGINTVGAIASFLNPASFLGNALAQYIKFGSVEVIVKDTNGNVIGTGTSQPIGNAYMEIPQE